MTGFFYGENVTLPPAIICTLAETQTNFAMKEHFKAIADALQKSGFRTSLEDISGKSLDFKITPYSLNSKLSFRFESLEEFAEFIKISGSILSEEKTNLINTALIELGIDAKDFFYVNFFEHGKEEDM